MTVAFINCIYIFYDNDLVETSNCTPLTWDHFIGISIHSTNFGEGGTEGGGTEGGGGGVKGYKEGGIFRGSSFKKMS